MDTVFTSGDTYKVGASIGDHALEEYSVVRKGDEIRPFFKNSVNGDPDVAGLSVFLQNQAGIAVSGKVHYLLSTEETVDSDESAEEEVLAEESSPSDLTISVQSLDDILQVFLPPDNLATGQYVLVFQVMGERDVLYRYEQPIMFLSGEECALESLHGYLPGISSGSSLIPPGVNILLKADLNYSENLDPYVIWYYGKRQIGSGRVSAGGDALLWEVPEQNGFHTIRAEIFPFLERSSIPKNLSGLRGELSLAVSSKVEKSSHFSADADSYIHWYQFPGNLEDSAESGNAGSRSLKSSGDIHPAWEISAGIYGLSLKPDYYYEIPDFPFIPVEESVGRGNIKMHFSPQGEGSILTCSFDFENSSDPLVMRLSTVPEGMLFELSLGPEYKRAMIPRIAGESQVATADISFIMSPQTFSARLKVDGQDFIGEDLLLPLQDSLSGKGFCRIGGPAGQDGAAETGTNGVSIAVVDELLIDFFTESILAWEAAKPEQTDELSLPDISSGEESPAGDDSVGSSSPDAAASV